MELLGADGPVCQVAWGNMVLFHGCLEDEVHSSIEWDSDDVTISDGNGDADGHGGMSFWACGKKVLQGGA